MAGGCDPAHGVDAAGDPSSLPALGPVAHVLGETDPAADGEWLTVSETVEYMANTRRTRPGGDRADGLHRGERTRPPLGVVGRRRRGPTEGCEYDGRGLLPLADPPNGI